MTILKDIDIAAHRSRGRGRKAFWLLFAVASVAAVLFYT